MRYLKFVLIFLFTVTVYPGVNHASEFGTPDEARAMLQRAVKALQMRAEIRGQALKIT